MGWFKRKAWGGAYVVLLTAGAYVTADLVNLLVGRQLEASIRVEEHVVPPVSRLPLLSSDPEAYRRIIEGNLFNPSLRGSLAPTALVPDAPPAPLSLPLDLIGTGERQGGASLAIIEDRSSHEQGVYRVNDVVKDGATLTKVERNQVVLRLGAQEQVLTLYSGGTENVASLPSSALPVESQPVQGTGIRQVQPNRWLLDKKEVTAALDNLPQLLTKARVVPNFTDGKPDGFKIFSIAPDSLYAKIGLQNGDVLQQINGVEIKNPENFMRVFQQLKDEPNIAIDFVRNNLRESYNYEIR